MSPYHTKKPSGLRGWWTLYDLAEGSAFLCCAALSAACFAAALIIGDIGFPEPGGSAGLDAAGFSLPLSAAGLSAGLLAAGCSAGLC